MKAPILYSPMMGMGASLSLFTETPAVTIEDYLFDNTTTGEVTPLATGTVSDFHDTFDLDGTDYMPEASPDDEGYWDDFSNIVTNGGFDADSDWNKGTGWTISSGKAHVDCTSTAALYQDLTLGVGNVYFLEFTISNYVAGTLQAQFGGDVIGSTTANGTVSFYQTATATSTRLYLYAIGTSEFSIDNVSVTEYAITPLDV